MKLERYSYMKRNRIKAYFDHFPDSPVIFSKIGSYYFVYVIQWSEYDPIVLRRDLEEMEWLINKELGFSEEYINRRSHRNN
ncbi:hypothetical protein BpOF4_10430 [Alkalihalophilus pseudofirmus OF4]|uniref:Uncharacterized protein n=1 Tax=Alkalihalophilus pseudofirmus (strain ATCC BAA-2126 / JCM 17055 / OF4) TaxID=398511 RepID=D3FUG9_ALKPO|nr:hypothetical protein BpOF4_10430 [Alkalihalophilus pseudofirmus OF4]